MKFLLSAITILLLFVACEEDGPTGNNNNNTDKGLVGCWEIFDLKSYSDTGTVTFHPKNIGSDTLVFNDSIWWSHSSSYSYDPWTDAWEWTYYGLSGFGEYSATDDSIYFQYQSDLANPVPEAYILLGDTLIRGPDEYLIKARWTTWYRRINCSLPLPGIYGT